jgi:guanylate kinase
MAHQMPTGLWTISGPSGAGKTTLLTSLLQKFPKAKPLLRVTTRAQRPTDVPGEYEYLSIPQFEEQGQAGRFLWVAPMHGYFHAAPKDTIDDALSDTSLTIADISPGVTEVLFSYAQSTGKHRLIRSIYLDIQDQDEIRRRLTERNQDNIDRRVRECQSWYAKANQSYVPFCIIDASAPCEAVLEQALVFLSR